MIPCGQVVSPMRLLEPFTLGSLVLRNRIVMAPMSRSRSGPGGVPTPLNALYYEQRASAGLIVAEATAVSPAGVAHPQSPGLYSDEQAEGWRRVADAVHRAGGVIFVQLLHAGRASHPDLLGGEIPVAPSPIKPTGNVFTPAGVQEYVTPRELTIEEIQAVVDQFVRAARLARDAGLDGVEVHGANGYLPHQFLSDMSNRRTDAYGGSIENRCRFVLELVEALCAAWAPSRVGLRISPSGTGHGMLHSDPVETFDHLAQRLSAMGLGFLHVIEPRVTVAGLPQYLSEVTPQLRASFAGTLVTGGGYDRESGERALERGIADLVAYGRLFLANPDLPRRFEANVALNTPHEGTFYSGGEEGYTDYPFWRGSSTPPA